MNNCTGCTTPNIFAWYAQRASQNRENEISRYLTVQSRIEILIGFEFRGILRYKFKLRFLFNLNLQLTNMSPTFRISITTNQRQTKNQKKIHSVFESHPLHGTGCLRYEDDKIRSAPKNGLFALWPSTNGAFPYFLVLPDCELSILENTEYIYFIPLNLSRELSFIPNHVNRNRNRNRFTPLTFEFVTICDNCEKNATKSVVRKKM